MRLIEAKDVVHFLPMVEAIAALKQAYLEQVEKTAIVPSKVIMDLEKDHAEFFIMPAYLKSREALGMKIASLYPGNPKKGLPAIHSKILMVDTVSGKFSAIIDGESVTNIKTGAVTGLVTDWFAKKDSKSVAVIGIGPQARGQLEAVCSVRKIESVNLYTRTVEKSHQFSEEIRKKYPKIQKVSICTTAKEAVENIDIVCFSTSYFGEMPLISINDVNSDTHINAIGGGTSEACEFPPEILKNSLLVTDNKPACQIESGEIKKALKEGIIQISDINDLSDVVSKNLFSTSKRVVYRSVGYAFLDMVLSKYLYDRVVKNNAGIEI